MVYRIRREVALDVSLSALTQGQDLHALVDRGDGIDVELSCLNGGKHIVRQNQGLDVLLWDNHTLASCQAHQVADGEEACDLLVYTADRLDVTELVMLVEREFDIAITDAEAESCITFGDIADLVAQRIA